MKRNYRNIVFWCIVVALLYLSYEWLSDVIFRGFNYLDVKYMIVPDVLLPSINAFVDTLISVVLIVIYLILAVFIVKMSNIFQEYMTILSREHIFGHCFQYQL